MITTEMYFLSFTCIYRNGGVTQTGLAAVVRHNVITLTAHKFACHTNVTYRNPHKTELLLSI